MATNWLHKPCFFSHQLSVIKASSFLATSACALGYRCPYLPCLTVSHEEQRLIDIWGQRHLRYLRQHRKALYTELQITGKLNGYLSDLDEQAENLFLELVKQMAVREGVTEQLKAQNQMLWVQRMNSIWNRAMEVVNNDLNYA